MKTHKMNEQHGRYRERYRNWTRGISVLFLFLLSGHFSQAQSLYAIDFLGGQSRMIVVDEATGATTPVMTFPASVGRVGRLTWAPDQGVFYAYGDLLTTTATNLLRINVCDSSFVDLGDITLNGNQVFPSEGLSYDPVTEELYAALSTVFNSPTSNRLVILDQTTAVATLVGNVTQGPTIINNELDVIEFVGTANPSSTLLGFDNFPGNNSAIYTVDYNGGTPGTATTLNNYGTPQGLGDFAYLESADELRYVGSGVIGNIDPATGALFGPTIPVLGAGTIYGAAWGPLASGCAYELEDIAVTCDSIDCICCGNPTVCIPFSTKCEVQDSMIGIDFCVNYDQTMMTPTGNVSLGDVVLDGSPDADYAINYVMTPGELHVSIFYLPSAPVTAMFEGAGEIACVEFSLSSSYQTGDTLDLSVCEVIEGFQTSVEFECADTGSFVLLDDDILEASLIYWNDDTRPLRYDQANPADFLITDISGTDANCTVTNPNVGVPDINGNFTYDINNGPSIEILRDIQGNSTSSAPCPSPSGVMPVINGMDAYWTSLVTTLNGSFVPNPYQIVAMDVNMDGFVSANDITHIQNRTIGNICEYPQAWNYPNPTTNSLDWRFIDRTTVENSPEYTVSNVYPANDMVGYSKYNVPDVPFCLEVAVDSNGTFCTTVGEEDFNGILLGDANGSWTGNTPTVVIKQLNDEVFYDLSQVTVDQNCVFSIPVYYTSSDNLMALDFSMDYDESRLNLQNIVPASGATGNMIGAHNDLGDQVLFTSYSSVPGGINLVAPVYYLQFTSIDDDIYPNDLGSITSYFNGSAVTSTITGTTISCSTLDVTQISEDVNALISPNPFEDELNVHFGTDLIEETTITVYDLQGRKKIELDCLSNGIVSINTKELAAGAYMIFINEKSIGKVVKL
ncbi:MAG: T9SS type A sorting domain-containing protein [Crocinitomicaceae bacterium]|nr:T9SS type A sorting domain-containing protein [Crocinitomicaceae bacterium]